MQIEGAIGDSIKLLESALCHTPEALNAVDMRVAASKLISPVLDAKVFRVANIYQAIIATPAVTVNHRLWCDATTNDGLKRGFLAVGHDLGEDRTVTLEYAEDDSFTKCSSATLATHSSGAEVRFIHFDLA